ncbi:MAG TPA: DUF4476 domain-containing protein [Chitinophagaceae bacterium]|nr:DUF4476 domain-containing protein [Chitinophagaceae bacterium]MCB9054303.1 DUF4476 domain-containing protein [Chitinophagales bacterium]HPG11687.1 DUF4476 domain-containing protein [Chitinophagaceae bacterium]HRX94468.1 DUF4476 domain-containing protein [Chitinophagaceae bacterium]
MKKIFTLLSFLAFSLSLLAFDGSRLSISAVSTSTVLKVEVDGREFSMKDNSLTLGYLSQGRHHVKISREKTRNGFRTSKMVIYNSDVFLKKGYHLDITVNRFGKVLMDEQIIDQRSEWYNDEDDYYDDDRGGWKQSNIMSSQDFNVLADQLRREWYEANRLKSAKFIIDKNYFTSAQVKELMLLFTFENNRLEIAKYAYDKTVDQRNYYVVNDALSFGNSRDELTKVVRTPRF